jgi:PHD/YefM family antitoxin component YafN of YafNO toxin-antitoxin module
MIRETSAMTVQHNLSEMHNKVQFQHEQFIITDAGKPVAALVDMMIFEKIRQNEQAFQSMSDEIALAFAESSEDDIDALISEAKKA